MQNENSQDNNNINNDLLNNNTNISKYEKLSIYDNETGLPIYPIYEIFSEKFPDFICQICLQFVIDPVECATCQNIFCNKCANEYSLNSLKCPNRCPKNFRKINRILKNMINSIKVQCIFFHKGCKEMLTYENYDRHIKELCLFSPYYCTNCYYCDIKDKIINHCKICNILKKDINNDKNIFEDIKCKFCFQIYGNDLNFKNNKMKLIAHEYLCNEQKVKCKYCERNLKLDEYRKHFFENKCSIYQLENKIEFLNEKIVYYEDIIENSNINDIKKYKLKNNDDLLNKRIILFNNNINKNNIQLNNNNINKLNKTNKENNNNNNKIDSKINNKFEIELNSGQIINLNLLNKNIIKKSNKITLLNSNINCKSNNEIFFSTSSNFNLEFNSLNLKDNTSKTINNIELKEIPEILSKNRFNKLSSIKISNILQTKVYEEEDLYDYFIITDNSYYFLYDNKFKELIKSGKPINSPCTVCINIKLNNEIYILLGSITSNVIILDAYQNKILYTLNHNRKKITSLDFISNLNVILSSSVKENALYVWKQINNNNNEIIFELKNTIKEHESIIWNIKNFEYNNCYYIVTAGGDKKIIIYKIILNNNGYGIMKILNINEFNDSVILINIKKLINNNIILFCATFDGTIKVYSLEMGYNKYNSNNIKELIYRNILIVFNKDFIINNMLILEKNKNNLLLLINTEAYSGYVIYDININYKK